MAKYAPNSLAMCVIVKNEDSYIEEWVAFHITQGVSFFLVVDNGQSPHLAEILQPYIAQGIVELMSITKAGPAQLDAYEIALKKFRKLPYEWLAFIDVDEFLFSPTGKTIPEILKGYEQAPGLVVNWVSFGSSGHVDRPKGLVIENYTYRGELDHQVPYEHLQLGLSSDGMAIYRPINSHVKSIVRVSKTLRPISPHHFSYKKKAKAQNLLGEKCDGPWTETIDVDQLRLNHYWSKSLEDLKDKVSKGRADTDKPRTLEEVFMRDSACSGVQDSEIVKLVPKVKAVMADFAVQRKTESAELRNPKTDIFFRRLLQKIVSYILPK